MNFFQYFSTIASSKRYERIDDGSGRSNVERVEGRACVKWVWGYRTTVQIDGGDYVT